MNIQEILNMVDEDIARAEEQQPDNKEENIDFLLSELEASRELDEDRLAEKYLAMHTMYQFLTRPGNLIKILDCKDQLTLGECLPMLTYLPWVKDTEFERLCLEASFCSLYNHFNMEMNWKRFCSHCNHKITASSLRAAFTLFRRIPTNNLRKRALA